MKRVLLIVRIFFPSRISVFLLRLMGFHIGRNVKISFFSYLNADKIELGNDVEIRVFCFISAGYLKLGNSTVLSYGSLIKGIKGFVTGDNCFVGTQSIIHCDEEVRLGFYSSVGVRNKVYTHGSFLPSTMGFPVKFAPIIIEDYVWIGMNVSITAGAYIESNCIIQPNVAVSWRVPQNSIVQIKYDSYKVFHVKDYSAFLGSDASTHYQNIICGFLDFNHISYRCNENKILCNNKNKNYIFETEPENRKITLSFSSKKIIYDLETFFVSDNNNSFHTEFLFYMNRRHGLKFRVKYSS